MNVTVRQFLQALWMLLMIGMALPLSFILAATNTMLLNTYLIASDNSSVTSRYVSDNGAFCFGFQRDMQPGKEGNYYLSVWYNVISPVVVVWVATLPDDSVPHVGTGSNAHLTADGNLIMGGATGSLTSTWQTNTANQGVVHAQILDSGNFVLVNATGGVVWQSFDSPSAATLLPGQYLAPGKKLQSENAAGRFFKGSFFLVTTPYLSLVYGATSSSTTAPSRSYWLPDTSSNTSGSVALENSPLGILRFSDNMGQTIKEFRPSDYNESGNLRRLKLDSDGNLRIYSWQRENSKWDAVWIAVADLCRALTNISVSVCGTYGICISYPGPTCVCPPAFEPNDATDISSGCRTSSPSLLSAPSSNTSCSAQQDAQSLTQVAYIQLNNINFRENDIMSYKELSETDCLQRCSDNCDCYGVIYELSGSTSCWLKSVFENGVSPQNTYNARASLKVYINERRQLTSIIPAGPPSLSKAVTTWSNNSYWSNSTASCDASIDAKRSDGVVRTAALVCAVAVGELLCFGILGFCVIQRRRNSRKVATAVADAGCRSFTHWELAEATAGFSCALGSGSFGEVFKGTLSDGRVVAVKRLEEGRMARAEGQFRAEIATIGKIHHINLLRLYGYCADGLRHRMLVYEYMENGSLDGALFSTAPRVELGWAARFKICLGTARGLTYLHDECLDRILHCDIKPQNILLDGGLNAKVADFGLAYLYDRDETTFKVSTIRGTRGYLAPEWLSNRPITAKADVYSYGMLVIEIISGRSNYRFSDSSLLDGKWDFPIWVLRQVQEGKVEQVVDPKLRSVGEVDYEQVRDLLQIALLCLQKDPAARPRMREITQMLEGILAVPSDAIAAEAIVAFDQSNY